MTPTNTLVNCPIVPDGSTAKNRLSGNDTGLHQGWYQNKTVTYFNFSEAPLTVTEDGMVPVSPIYVAFNVNPGMANGGPPSGFKMIEGSMQSHNAVATLPGDVDYSPLWSVSPYDQPDVRSRSHDSDRADTKAVHAVGASCRLPCKTKSATGACVPAVSITTSSWESVIPSYSLSFATSQPFSFLAHSDPIHGNGRLTRPHPRLLNGQYRALRVSALRESRPGGSGADGQWNFLNRSGKSGTRLPPGM